MHPATVLRWLMRAAVLAALVASASSTVAAPAMPAAWRANAYSGADERLLGALINQARAEAGLPALAVDPYVAAVARWRSRDMATRDYFSHAIPPTNESVFDRMRRDGYCFAIAGENIGRNALGDAVATLAIHAAFMGSREHRSNVLGAAWTVVGIGAYEAADGTKTWTEIFAEPCTPWPPPLKAG